MFTRMKVALPACTSLNMAPANNKRLYVRERIYDGLPCLLAVEIGHRRLARLEYEADMPSANH